MKKQKLVSGFLAIVVLAIFSINFHSETRAEEERESGKCNGGGIKCPPYKYKTMKW